MSGFDATQSWLSWRFETRVKPLLFGRPARHSASPTGVLIGGQPGAGKTRAAEFVQSLYGGELVVINGDDFRALHPDYKWLQRHDPVRMPAETAKITGPLVERSIAYAAEHGYAVLVEGTFRSVDTSLGTVRRLADTGYRVHAVALAVPPAVSRISAVARFYETLDTGDNRWTPLQAHEAALTNMPSTVDALGTSEQVHRLSLLDRDGQILFDSTQPGAERGREARGLLERAHTRELTAAEARQVRTTYIASRRVAASHPTARAMADDDSVQYAWLLIEADVARLATSGRTQQLDES